MGDFEGIWDILNVIWEILFFVSIFLYDMNIFIYGIIFRDMGDLEDIW